MGTRKFISTAIGLSLLLISGLTWAQSQDLEKEAKRIEAKLIAPCCWTYPVSEHHSEAAMEIKAEIRTRLQEGASEETILAQFEKRFGERILTTPTARGFNVMIWVFPFIIFLVGSALVYLALRYFNQGASRSKEETKPLVEAESASDEAYRQRLDDELYRQDH